MSPILSGLGSTMAVRAEAGRSQSGLDAGMASTHHDDVELQFHVALRCGVQAVSLLAPTTAQTRRYHASTNLP